MRQLSVVLIVSAAVLFSAQSLFAQAQGFSGNMIGGGGGGGMGMGGSSFGGGGMSGGGMGMGMGGGMGNSSTGGLTMLSASSLSGGFGLLGFGAMNGFGSSSSGGSSMYGGRTYGAVTQAGGGQGMSGNRTGSSGSTSSSTSGSGGAGAASTAGRRRGATNTSTASKEQQAWFEPRIEIGFEVPAPQVAAIAATVATTLGTNNPGSRFRGVQVAFEGGTAILRGVVATPNDRILAEQIALLEPSVSAVRNNLTIAGGTSPAKPQ